MNLKKVIGLTLATVALNSLILADANAASVSVKCEVRNNRSKASVDGAGLRGKYVATLTSGGKTITSQPLSADPVSREVEFDFDSNRNDILDGATAIPANFIKKTKVAGGIYVASTGALIGKVGADCQVK